MYKKKLYASVKSIPIAHQKSYNHLLFVYIDLTRLNRHLYDNK